MCTAQTFQIKQDTNHVFEGVLGLQLFPKWTIALRVSKIFRKYIRRLEDFGRKWQKLQNTCFHCSGKVPVACGSCFSEQHGRHTVDARHTSIILSTCIHLDYIGNIYISRTTAIGTLQHPDFTLDTYRRDKTQDSYVESFWDYLWNSECHAIYLYETTTSTTKTTSTTTTICLVSKCFKSVNTTKTTLKQNNKQRINCINKKNTTVYFFWKPHREKIKIPEDSITHPGYISPPIHSHRYSAAP